MTTKLRPIVENTRFRRGMMMTFMTGVLQSLGPKAFHRQRAPFTSLGIPRLAEESDTLLFHNKTDLGESQAANTSFYGPGCADNELHKSPKALDGRKKDATSILSGLKTLSL